MHFPKRCVLQFLEYRTTDKARKPSNSEVTVCFLHFTNEGIKIVTLFYDDFWHEIFHEPTLKFLMSLQSWGISEEHAASIFRVEE
jgi:hypothetical protein